MGCLTDHNKNILSKYTRDKGYINLRVEQIDLKTSKVLNVFKNRYDASRWILENKLSGYISTRGIGFARAAVAGNLTNCMIRTGNAYGYKWRMLSPHSNKTVTKKFERTEFKVGKRYHWIVIENNKETKFYNKEEIAKLYNCSVYNLNKMIYDGKVSVIPFVSIPREKEFKSLSEASRFLRVKTGTVRKAMENSKPIRGFIPRIPKEFMAKNMAATARLRK